MRNVLCLLLLVVLVVSCKSKLPTTPSVTDADIELYDQKVVAPSGSVDWEGKVLNRSAFVVDVALKLELTAPNETTPFYTSTEKLLEVGQGTIVFFNYSETSDLIPPPNLPPTWTWRIRSRLVTFHK